MQQLTASTSLIDSLDRDARRFRRRGVTWPAPALTGHTPDEIRTLVASPDRDVYAPVVSALVKASSAGDTAAGTVLVLGLVDLLAGRSRSGAESTRRYLDKFATDLWAATATSTNPTSRYARENVIRQARHTLVASERRNEPNTSNVVVDDIETSDHAFRGHGTTVEQQALTSCQIEALLDQLVATKRIAPGTRRVLLATAHGVDERPNSNTERSAYMAWWRQVTSARSTQTREALVA